MPTRPGAEVSELYPSVQQEIANLCAAPEIRSAFTWFRAQEPQFAQWQLELARIAAPPFGEGARGAWLAGKFKELGFDTVHADEVGNVFGVHPGFGHGYVTLSAHLDTVFPAGTPLNMRQQGSRLYGPGVSDNGAGVTAMLAIAAALLALYTSTCAAASFHRQCWGRRRRRSARHAAHFFDAALERFDPLQPGARWRRFRHHRCRSFGQPPFEVIVRGPGGHSWSDFGAPNPIVMLARAIRAFARRRFQLCRRPLST